MPRMVKYFFKLQTIYTCYDRTTGLVVGDSLTSAGDIAVRCGINVDERIDGPVARITYDNEEAYHKVVFQNRFGKILR